MRIKPMRYTAAAKSSPNQGERGRDYSLMGVRLRILRKWRVAAWFGLLALGLQAYIPIHLTNDIVHAVNDLLAVDAWQSTSAVAMDEDGSHSHPGGGHSNPSHRDCATFLSAPGANAFVLPALLELRRPDLPALPQAVGFTDPVLRTACPASYASRAPPVTA
jgi:hypothetical protein